MAEPILRFICNNYSYVIIINNHIKIFHEITKNKNNYILNCEYVRACVRACMCVCVRARVYACVHVSLDSSEIIANGYPEIEAGTRDNSRRQRSILLCK